MSERGDVNIKTILGITVLMIIVAFGTSYIFFNMVMNEGGAAREYRAEYRLGEFTVNLLPARSYYIVRADIVLQVNNKDSIDELQERNAEIRDTVNTILRAQHLSIMEEPGAKTVKEEIKSKINEILNGNYITNVWFDELIVQ